MKSNLDYIREFLLCGSGKLLTRKEIRQYSFFIGFFNVFYLIFGFILKGTPLIISIIMLTLWLAFTFSLFLPFNQKDNQTNLFFLFNGLLSVFILFMLLPLILFLLQSAKLDIWIHFSFIAVFLLFLIIYFAFSLKKIKSEYYTVKNEKYKNKKTSRIYIIIQMICIIFISNVIFPNIDEKIAFLISSISLLFLLAAISLGTINFLKYYYVKKHKIEIESMTNFFKNYS